MIRLTFAAFWIFTLVLLTVSCSDPSAPVVHLRGETMGTTYNIKYVVGPEGKLGSLKDQVDERLAQINLLMSTYDPTSELSRFNQNRYTDPFPISAQTRVVIEEAMRLGELSNGVLDVTVGPLVNLWGFGPNKRPEKTPSDEDITAVRDYVGLNKLQLTSQGLVKHHPMIYVDLSTIAKGYGVDQLAQLLENKGLENYLVEIGGEMRVKGHRGNGEDWLIAIEKPITTERAVQKIVSIGTNAIATSGDYRNYYEQDGFRYSHLIDPRTGKPIKHNLVSVTVVHPSSMTADGWATAFMIMGWEQAKLLAERENLAVYLIRRTGKEFEEFTSSKFNDVVEIHN